MGRSRTGSRLRGRFRSVLLIAAFLVGGSDLAWALHGGARLQQGRTVRLTSRAPTQRGVLIHSSLHGVDVLPTRVRWEASPNIDAAQVASVAFWIDGHLVWVRYAPPYVYGDSGSWLEAAALTPGRHTFVTSVVTTSGDTTKETVTAVVMRPMATLAF